MTILSKGNSKLKKDGIVSIGLPPIKTCPGASDCKKYCYACTGFLSFGKAKEKRQENFKKIKNKTFLKEVTKELKKEKAKIIRLHDSGDIFNMGYMKTLVQLCKAFPSKKFYAYTKSLPIIQKYGWNNIPTNFNIVQSTGGKYDNLINPNKPIARIFKSKKDIPNYYTLADKSDLVAADPKNKRIALIVHGARKTRFV